uniref:NADH dehydrogenase [ubiquinone] 1 alpha subcomplex subunit 3 n=1 Tax=Seriola lalandi dorsalis TaxID=1841481 RepID=A0A3B4XQJ4_SERLL
MLAELKRKATQGQLFFLTLLDKLMFMCDVRRRKNTSVSRYYISHEHPVGSTTPDNMAGIGAFLKNAWNKEPVILASCAIGVIGVAIPFISPITKYTGMINSAVPYNYPGKHCCHVTAGCLKCHISDASATTLSVPAVQTNSCTCSGNY